MLLNFPKYEFRTKEIEGKDYIFDIARKKYVRLLPEEYVRQHLLKYMIIDKKYPPGLTKIEHRLKVDQQIKYTDITVFDRKGDPVLIAECKSYKIKLTQDTISQITNYNKNLNVKIYIITNGLQHFVIDMEKETPEYLNDIPDFSELLAEKTD